MQRVVTGYTTWWAGLTRWQRYSPLILILLYAAALFCVSGGAFTPDHARFCTLVLVLGYSGRPGRILLKFLMPFLLTAVVYDSQRHWGDYVRAEVQVAWPYETDKRLFGIQYQGKVLTPNEYLQLHLSPVLDFFCGLAYIIFIAVFIATAAFFRFALGERALSSRMMWGFFWLNIIGYSTYYWFPAAPPWYVEKYGLGPADLTAQASQAGAVRFDQLMGTSFFSEFYGRSADVFGAIPSLHIAYPLLAFFYSLKVRRLRIFSFLFYALMCLAAVYLNHHYVVDVLWGSVYSVLIYVVMERFYLPRRLTVSPEKMSAAPT